MAGTPIESLKLSVRAINVLHRMKINEVEQLLNTPIEHIAEQRNIGVKTITEIQKAVEQVIEGKVDFDSLVFFDSDRVSNMGRVFTEEQINELSRHFVTELNLSNRAINVLMRNDCITMDKLANMSDADIRGLKGLGAKVCDEILQGLSQWLESNMVFVGGDTDKIISEDEQLFYTELARKINPIIPIYWKRLRNIIVNAENLEITSYELETINDDCIGKVLSLKEMEDNIKKLFLHYAPDGIIKVSGLEEQLSSLSLEFDISVFIERILHGINYAVKDNYCFLNRPHVMQYLQEKYSDSSDRNGQIILRRLLGDNLQTIGDMHGLTRERVRQILVKTAKSMPLMYEDYFREPYSYFKLSKEEFCNAFPFCGEVGYEYLFIKYKKGDQHVTPESVESYSGYFSERMKAFLSEESIRKDRKTVSRTEVIYRVLLSNSDRAMSINEFEKEYYDYIEQRNYPRERLVINLRTVINHLRNARHIVFNRNNRVRYCEVDSKVVWEMIDFSQYNNLVISTELIYRDYAELMDELDIRDGYELFYVIKSSLEDGNRYYSFAINCRRVPVVVMGDGSEERQAIQLLKEISPIEFQTYYEAYEERFGVRKESAQGNPTITGALVNYYSEGLYSIDVPTIDERDINAFKEALEIKKFWFTEELERKFKKICIHSSIDAFNSAAFKRLGYSLNMGYAYNDIYSSVVNCFNEEIFSEPIVDLNKLDRRLVNLSAFGSAVYKKKMDLEYIEVAPKILMAMTEVERSYGITVNDVRALQEWVLDCSDKYYNAHSLWNELSKTGLVERLQNNEWMCTCIFRQQESVASLQVAGGIILCREYNELNFGAICKWLVERSGRMTIQSLTMLFNDTFSTRVSVSKIAEKMKAYGLWDSFVIDSFDEYIDNLVMDAELEMDEEKLFQEEFF
ncbi:MAG: hypothetical protein HFG28_11925 [Eubacterium sp.]|nr:hypothetical protein [Eubacterium sp.]